MDEGGLIPSRSPQPCRRNLSSWAPSQSIDVDQFPGADEAVAIYADLVLQVVERLRALPEFRHLAVKAIDDVVAEAEARTLPVIDEGEEREEEEPEARSMLVMVGASRAAASLERFRWSGANLVLPIDEYLVSSCPMRGAGRCRHPCS